MSVIVFRFDGWFQCRLATNPDPSDEPRGVSGYTFALPGEPDLDRVIRFHDPIAPRSHGPEVGVFVHSVEINGAAVDEWPLLGARLDLVDAPRFESRNRLLTDDRGGIGLIHPFHIHLSAGHVSIGRKDVLHPAEADLPLYKVPVELLNRRAPTQLDGIAFDPLRVAEATAIHDASAYRRERKRQLEADLEMVSDPVQSAALQKRIEELTVSDTRDLRLLSLGFVQTWRFNINGDALVHDPQDTFREKIDVESPWSIDFWMGAWDADALCGFTSGALEIPLRS